MELTQLKQFVAVAESGSLSAAAARLYMSQPALSTMLKKLEAELGTALFERTRNRITLNEAGGLALAHARRILAQAEQMKTELRDFARRDRLFNVGFCDPGPMWSAVPKFAMMFPDYTLQPQLYSSEQEALAGLYNGRFDLLVSAVRTDDNDLICQPLCRDQLLLSVPRGMVSPLPDSLLLRNAPVAELVLFQAEGAFNRQNQALYQAAAERIALTRFDDFFLFQQHLRDTQAATVNTRIVRHYREDGGNRDLIPLADPEASIDYYVIYQAQNEERVKPLRQWLTAAFG